MFGWYAIKISFPENLNRYCQKVTTFPTYAPLLLGNNGSKGRGNN